MDKDAQFAGSFYPAEADEINKLIDSYNSRQNIQYKSKAIIVPHAGYVYSGHAAMTGFNQLQYSENIFIIAPSHREAFKNIAMPEYSFFNTPLGSLEVNTNIVKEIYKDFPSIISNDAFINEHSIEVQLPFIQHLFLQKAQNAVEFIKNINKRTSIKIIPILIGKCDYRLISDIIAKYWDCASFIISSDLSHFYTQNQCRQIDSYTAAIIESGRIDCFENYQVCGLIGIKGLVDFANKQNFSLIRAEMYNSGDISNDKDRVVGYGSWFLYEGNTNEYIERYYNDYVIELAEQSIQASIQEKEFIPENIPAVFTQQGATFVTLTIESQLRGCIGSIYPTKPLVLDIIDNAKNAAFHDPRFFPLSQEEFNKTEVSISLLSEPQKISYKDEKDLLTKIYPHGIILTEREKRAVYLPVVWEQLPDREIFLNSLKEKAGLPPNYFSRTIEAYKFNALHIERNNKKPL